MTLIEAKEILISAIDYMAYRETGTSLYDSDKNRLFGAEHYSSGRPAYSSSPWEGKDFEIEMAKFLKWAPKTNELNEAISALRDQEQFLSRIVAGLHVSL